MLWQRELPAADLVIRGARVLDPTEGIDASLEVRIDGGTIAEVAEHVDANGHRVVEAAGLVLAPAFVDPHVHLRTPGREDEETVASGTAASRRADSTRAPSVAAESTTGSVFGMPRIAQ